jgi:hypothetical protein
LRPTWNVEQLSQVHPTETCFREGWSLRFSLKEGDCRWESCCCTKMPVPLTLKTLRKLKWEVMERPAHSPHLAPSDFLVFGPLEEALGERRRRWDEDMKNAVHQCLHALHILWWH